MPKAWKSIRRTAAGLMALLALIPLSGGVGAADGQDGKKRTTVLTGAVSGPLTEFAGWDAANMEQVAARGAIALYVNMITSDFYLLNQTTQEIKYSSADVQADAVANDETKNNMQSLFSIEYYDSKNSQFTMNTYKDCLSYENQLSVEKIENGVESRFILGKQDTRRIIPHVLDKEIFEGYLERCEGNREMNALKGAYKLYTPQTVAAASNKEELLKQYPVLADQELYVLRPITSTRELKGVEDIYVSLGLTADDVDAIHEKWNIQLEVNETAVFEIPMTITLDEEGELVVEVETEQVVVPDKFILYQLNLLEYFGAAFQNESGYIFVPDGSGAIIDFYAGRSDATYIKQLYGEDKTIMETERTFLGQNAVLPVFGMAQSRSAMFTVIEGDDALASVVANTPGRMSSYYTVFSRFTLSPRMYMNYNQMMHDSGAYIFPSDISRQPIRQRYIWMTGENVTYVDIAKTYRRYLEKNDTLKRLEEKPESTPFYMDLQGVIEKKKNILGIGYTSTYPLTTFDQAQEIVLAAKEMGIADISMRYRAWSGGGYDNRLNDTVTVEKALGGQKGFQKLSTFLEERGAALYPETEFLYVASDKAFDAFRASRDAAHCLDKKVATDYRYDIAGRTRMTEDSFGRYLLSPKKLETLVSSFLQSYKPCGVTGLSAGSMGKDLNADYSQKNSVDRNRAAAMVAGGLANIRDSGLMLMVDGGNAYSLAYADVIMDIPLTSSRTIVEDRAVPFYQIVIHGYIEYAGEPINTSQNHVETLLKSVETGAGLQYKWMYAQDSVLKDSPYAYSMYSMHYGSWLSDAAALYRRVDDVLKGTRSATIDEHEEIAPRVFRTVYTNGIAVVVNYNDTAVEVDAGTVGAMDFIRIGE